VTITFTACEKRDNSSMDCKTEEEKMEAKGELELEEVDEEVIR